MDINVIISSTMDKETGWNDEYEHRVVRVPKACREKHNMKAGEFINLRNKNGGLEVFQIAEAFKEDVAVNDDSAYVTTNNYEKLAIKQPGTGEVERIVNITLGCDPESFLADSVTGNLIAAHRFMRKYGDVGHDGMLLEFRPNPSTSAEQVCNNLWALIQKGRGMLNAFAEGKRIEIVGGSSYAGLTAGFHLHYGMPRGLLGRHPDVRVIARLMTAAFDYYVGVPSIIPEGNEDTARRTTKFVDYGKPGGYRLDNRTFEFRMPGGINLVHPILTKGLIALGAVVAEDVASRINTCTDSFTNLKEMVSDFDLRGLYPNIPDVHTFYAIICSPDIAAAKAHFEVIKQDVRQMIGYTQRAEAVESYFQQLDSGVKYGNNILQNWGGFYNEKQQEQVVVL